MFSNCSAGSEHKFQSRADRTRDILGKSPTRVSPRVCDVVVFFEITGWMRVVDETTLAVSVHCTV